jgi:hypothetical protein
MIYTAYGKECRLTFIKIFDGQWGLRAEYKNNSGEWAYIAAPTIWTDALTTKEVTDAAYQKALGEINIATRAMLGKASSEPTSGTARIQWLVDNKTVVVDNNLKIG